MSGNSSCVHGVSSTKYSNVQRAWRINRKFRMPRAKIEKDLYLKREFEFPSVDIIAQLSFPLRSINIETSEKRYWDRSSRRASQFTVSNDCVFENHCRLIGAVKLISTPTIFLSVFFGRKTEARRSCGRGFKSDSASTHLEFKIGGNLLVALFERTSKRREKEEPGNSATIDLLIIRQLLTVFPRELRKYIASFREDRTTFDEIPFRKCIMHDASLKRTLEPLNTYARVFIRIKGKISNQVKWNFLRERENDFSFFVDLFLSVFGKRKECREQFLLDCFPLKRRESRKSVSPLSHQSLFDFPLPTNFHEMYPFFPFDLFSFEFPGKSRRFSRQTATRRGRRNW